jgi:plastocyanin
MKKTCALLIAGLASLQAIQAGDISGTVTLKGTPPPEKEIPQIKEDPNCGKLHTEAVKTRFYVVGANNGLGDVFVTLKEITGKSMGPSAPPAVIDQKGCEYQPYVLAVQTGQKIVVKNSDPVLHNIHPTPTAPGNKEENKAQMPNGPDLTFSFPSPETFLRVKCDVHPWMFAYLCVVDSPYIAVTDKGPTTAEVEVKGGAVTKDIALEAK